MIGVEKGLRRERVMSNAKKGAGGVPTAARDAVEWFVENQSDRELDEKTVSQWEEWCTHPRNNEAYTMFIQMLLQIAKLPAPPQASRDDLLRDVFAEPGPEH
jgi:ferric-dicitrate binding protein FerR (iron transport regulator)